MVFTPPFLRTSFQSALLSEPEGSAVASKAPISLCSFVIGGQKPYKRMAMQLGQVPLKRRKMQTPLNLASVASASFLA